jgi:hypothetical protein
MFDMQRLITLQGTVRAFQWTNPHCWIQVTRACADSTRGWRTFLTKTGVLSDVSRHRLSKLLISIMTKTAGRDEPERRISLV